MTDRRGRLDPVGLALGTFLGLVVLFMLSPLVFVVVNSFNASSLSLFPPEGVSLRWYRTVLEHRPFARGFANSVSVATTASLTSLLAGTLAALGLVRHRVRGRALFRSLFFAPLIVPRVAVGLGVFVLFVRWLVPLQGSNLGLALVHAALTLPFVVTIVSANLALSDPALEEAAADLGAGPLRAFWHVTLPQVRTGLVVAWLFAFITSFDEVETSIFLLSPPNTTLPIQMFIYMEQWQNPTLAALSTLLVAATLVPVLCLLPVLNTQEVGRLLARRAAGDVPGEKGPR
jgi:putative spermidine/putrescine transport system permease protein